MFGYEPVAQTPSLWRHKYRPITFTLVVDDLGIKYVGDEHFNHLEQALKQQYEVTVDRKGTKYLGLTIKWNYEQHWVEISMPGYVIKALKKFMHAMKHKIQHAPHQWNSPQFGLKGPQYLNDDVPSQPLPASGKKFVQKTVGTFF